MRIKRAGSQEAAGKSQDDGAATPRLWFPAERRHRSLTLPSEKGAGTRSGAPISASHPGADTICRDKAERAREGGRASCRTRRSRRWKTGGTLSAEQQVAWSKGGRLAHLRESGFSIDAVDILALEPNSRPAARVQGPCLEEKTFQSNWSDGGGGVELEDDEMAV